MTQAAIIFPLGKELLGTQNKSLLNSCEGHCSNVRFTKKLQKLKDLLWELQVRIALTKYELNVFGLALQFTI